VSLQLAPEQVKKINSQTSSENFQLAVRSAVDQDRYRGHRTLFSCDVSPELLARMPMPARVNGGGLCRCKVRNTQSRNTIQGTRPLWVSCDGSRGLPAKCSGGGSAGDKVINTHQVAETVMSVTLQ